MHRKVKKLCPPVKECWFEIKGCVNPFSFVAFAGFKRSLKRTLRLSIAASFGDLSSFASIRMREKTKEKPIGVVVKKDSVGRVIR